MTAPALPMRRIEGTAPELERPNYRRPEYVAQAKTRRLSRALVAGTEDLRSLGTEALPKWPAEEPAFYRLRAKIARLTRYYQRTVQATVGMIAGQAPTLGEETDERILRDWEDYEPDDPECTWGTRRDEFLEEYEEEEE
jgi:hypothetical protein